MGKGRQALDQVWRPLRFTYMARESCSHLPAFLGTAPTGCRAFLAMADVVFGAFLPAGVAGIGADLAECCCEGGTAGHLTGGDRAEVGATVVETDAPGHHRYVIFGETRACAVFTCQRACLARLNAFLIFFHMVPFWFGLRVGDACRRGGMQPAHRKRGALLWLDDECFIRACSSVVMAGMLSWRGLPEDPGPCGAARKKCCERSRE